MTEEVEIDNEAEVEIDNDVPKEIEITDSVPVPTFTRRHKYPFASLDVNDSFLIENPTGSELKKTRSRVASAACAFKRAHEPKWKFTTRLEGAGVRIWRVA